MVCNVKKKMSKVMQNVKMNKQTNIQSLKFDPTHYLNQV
jgi:hypothetical protein